MIFEHWTFTLISRDAEATLAFLGFAAYYFPEQGEQISIAPSGEYGATVTIAASGAERHSRADYVHRGGINTLVAWLWRYRDAHGMVPDWRWWTTADACRDETPVIIHWGPTAAAPR